jgi:hypothetical protein
MPNTTYKLLLFPILFSIRHSLCIEGTLANPQPTSNDYRSVSLTPCRQVATKVNLVINPNDRHAPELRHFGCAPGTYWSAHMRARTMPLRFEYKNVRRGADK